LIGHIAGTDGAKKQRELTRASVNGRTRTPRASAGAATLPVIAAARRRQTSPRTLGQRLMVTVDSFPRWSPVIVKIHHLQGYS